MCFTDKNLKQFINFRNELVFTVSLVHTLLSIIYMNYLYICLCFLIYCKFNSKAAEKQAFALLSLFLGTIYCFYKILKMFFRVTLKWPYQNFSQWFHQDYNTLWKNVVFALTREWCCHSYLKQEVSCKASWGIDSPEILSTLVHTHIYRFDPRFISVLGLALCLL